MIIKPKIVSESGTGSIEVRFLYLDIEDGKLVNKIVERYCNVGGSVTPPNIPTSLNAVSNQSCALNFYNWNITNLTNIQHDLDVGALYDTADGKTHAFVLVNTATGLSPTLYFNKSDTSTLTISWGDGSADYTTTSSGNLNTSHTYSTAGTYEITMWISSGSGNYSFGNGSSVTGFLINNYQLCLNYLFIGNNVNSISAYGLYAQKSNRFITLSHNINTINSSAFKLMSSLESITFPSVTSLGNYACEYCYVLQYCSLSSGIITLGIEMFNSDYSLSKFIIPDSVTSIGEYSFNYCYSLENIYIPSTVTTIGIRAFDNCTSLAKLNIPTSLTSVLGGAFGSCYSIKSEIIIPSGLTAISSGTFEYCYAVRVYTLKRYTTPSTITTLNDTSAFSGISFATRIYVPVGSLAVYQAAANWSTYATRMYEDTPENRALFGD